MIVGARDGKELRAADVASGGPPRRRPRVLLADDDPSIRTAVSRLLSESCEVVGVAADIPTLFAVIRLQPDVVLLDVSLRGGPNAFEVCRRLKAATPALSVVAFTAVDDACVRPLAEEAGGSGYVWKMRAAAELVPTIERAVARAALPDGCHTRQVPDRDHVGNEKGSVGETMDAGT